MTIMQRATTLWTRRKPAHFVLAALALVIKVLLPAGFMLSPAHAQAGLSPIILCTSQGEITAFMADDGTIVSTSEEGSSPLDHDEAPHAPCTFAGHGAPVAASLAQAVVLPQPRPVALPIRGQEAAPVPGLGLAAPPPPKTGPPLQV